MKSHKNVSLLKLRGNKNIEANEITEGREEIKMRGRTEASFNFCQLSFTCCTCPSRYYVTKGEKNNNLSKNYIDPCSNCT